MKLTRRRFLRLLGGGAAVAAGGASYALLWEPVWLRTARLDLPVPGLDAAFDGYTVAQLSDLHVGCGVPDSLLEEAAAAANAALPDLAVVTGDLVHRGGTPQQVERAAAVLSGLRARDGVVAVLGNHDCGVYARTMRARRGTADRLAGALSAAGIRLLRNEAEAIRRGRARLRVAGLGDLWSGEFDPDSARVRDPSCPTLVLSHNPDTAPGLARRGAELVLSGHTHGGQVRLPFLGAPILPVIHREYAAGLYEVGATRLYVNSGIGWLRRVRFGVRPEVTVLRLRAAPSLT
ncbi:MAG: metallophosphoesterase [Planctomycetota bacterium]